MSDLFNYDMPSSAWQCRRCGVCCVAWAEELDRDGVLPSSMKYVPEIEAMALCCKFYDPLLHACMIRDNRPYVCRRYTYKTDVFITRKENKMIQLINDNEHLIEVSDNQAEILVFQMQDVEFIHHYRYVLSSAVVASREPRMKFELDRKKNNQAYCSFFPGIDALLAFICKQYPRSDIDYHFSWSHSDTENDFFIDGEYPISWRQDKTQPITSRIILEKEIRDMIKICEARPMPDQVKNLSFILKALELPAGIREGLTAKPTE